jgi:MFS family permease
MLRVKSNSQETPISKFKYRSNNTLFILFAIYTCNAIDRNILVVLFEPIKKEFDLSDSELGFLATGFAVSYAVSGLFFGIAADRLSRRNLVAGCLTFWSVMTALCGLAQSFMQLFLGRIGVGIGEAGASPAAMSMISDLYPTGKRATAVSVYYLSSPIGFMIALAAGGWLEHRMGWHSAFLIAAMPGALLVPVLLLRVKEPIRGGLDAPANIDRPPLFSEFLRFAKSQRSLVLILVGTTINVLVLSGIGAWTVSYFVRTHALSVAQAGTYIGGLQGTMGILGTLTGGILADALGRRDVRARLWLISASMSLGVICAIGWILAPDLWVGIVFYGAASFANSLWYGPIYGIAQELVRVRMRATVAAVFYLVTNLGTGISPPLIGFLSDYHRAKFGTDGLAIALIAVSLAGLAGAVALILATSNLSGDLKRAMPDAPQPEQE